MNKVFKTAKQSEIADQLFQFFGIKAEKILFLNPKDENEPWIPSAELESIARQVGGFSTINVTFDQYVEARNQVIYQAVVVDSSGRNFSRSGSAKLGEKPNNEEIDTDVLASGRALGAALTAAGFNPYKSGSIVNLETMKEHHKPQNLSASEIQEHQEKDEAELRLKDLNQIHALATEKGLTIGKDDSRYRKELLENFGVRTAAVLDVKGRAAIINWLNNYEQVPENLREEALIA